MMASSSEAVSKKSSTEVEEKMKQFRKQLTAKQTMDKFKEAFDRQMKTSERHQQNVECLQRTLNSTNERKSYGDMFRELGGAEFQDSLLDDDIENILKQLVKTEKIMLTEEELNKLYKEWDKLLKMN